MRRLAVLLALVWSVLTASLLGVIPPGAAAAGSTTSDVGPFAHHAAGGRPYSYGTPAVSRLDAGGVAMAQSPLSQVTAGRGEMFTQVVVVADAPTTPLWLTSTPRVAGGVADDLSRAASVADRNGLTAAGRAAQKHGNRSGSGFPLSPDRTASGYNQFGQQLVDDLLTAPNTAVRSYVHPSYGQVTEYIGPQYGARWGPNGEFLGFL